LGLSHESSQWFSAGATGVWGMWTNVDAVQFNSFCAEIASQSVMDLIELIQVKKAAADARLVCDQQQARS
jgi:hypothetical protein